MKVFLTRELPEIAFRLLKKNKIPFDCYEKDSPIPRKRLLKEVQSCDGLVCLLTEQIDKEVFDKMKRCKVVANYAVGFNNIDVEYAKQKGIIVTNTPDVLTESTADLTMALVLACARRLTEGQKFLKAKKYKTWKPGLLLGTELKDKTLGIIGAGRIGTAVSIRAKAFGTNIIYHSLQRNTYLEKKTGAKKVTLNFLLKHADIISIHLPLNKETYHYFDSKKLQLVKQDSILINTSRGELIDEKYLIKYLEDGKFSSVGLDVFENEPDINPELLKFTNVLILPHMGSATNEARSGMAELAVRNVINVLKNKPPLTPVT
ncbi:MAG: D-glycerate dehydrogenase [Ignavibacterium sp.]|nr:MAG: D-glycerate dehydrogenase [Ignavibacterium sp.]